MIWTLLTQSRLARGIAWAFTAVLAVVTLGAVNRREGVKDERARRAVEDAKADQAAHERMNNADLGTNLDDAQRIERLRDFGAKHGARPPKAPGR